MSKKIKVLYIAGTARCGSTLLSKYLSNNSSIASVGELRYYWSRGLKENWLCSCGRNFNDCSTWSSITDSYLATHNSLNFFNKNVFNPSGLGLGHKRIRELLLQHNFELNKYIREREEVITLLNDLYKCIYDEIKGKLILDSSKNPFYALFLKNCPDIDLYILHVLRDPRAVVYSQAFKEKVQKIDGRRELVMGTTLFKSLNQWNIYNYLSSKYFGDYKKYKVITYENFIKDPDEVRNAIFNWLSINNSTAEKFYHSFSENPSRLRKIQGKLIEDKEWQKKLPYTYKLLIKFYSYLTMKKIGIVY